MKKKGNSDRKFLKHQSTHEEHDGRRPKRVKPVSKRVAPEEIENALDEIDLDEFYNRDGLYEDYNDGAY